MRLRSLEMTKEREINSILNSYITDRPNSTAILNVWDNLMQENIHEKYLNDNIQKICWILIENEVRERSRCPSSPFLMQTYKRGEEKKKNIISMWET